MKHIVFKLTITFRLLVLVIICSGAIASAQSSTVIGTIDRITGADMIVKTPRGSLTVHADDRTETVKEKIYRGISALKAGEEVSIHCEPFGTGKLHAVRIFANVITFSAIVKRIDGDDIEVLTIPNSDYAREEHRIVRIYVDTAFGARREEVTVGRDVRIVGLDGANGTIDAARIALYNTDLPVTK